MNTTTLIQKKQLKDTCLTASSVNGKDFSGYTITDVSFAFKEHEDRLLSHVNFSNATLKNVDFTNTSLSEISFENASLENCSFYIESNKTEINTHTINNVTFKKATIKDCRFRNTQISESDFRYAHIFNSSFENSKIRFSDFYRSLFIGINIFYDCKILDSSLPSHFDGTVFRKDNLYKGKILHENYRKYKFFLDEKRKTVKFDVDHSLKKRYKDAESTYRELSGLWNSKGFLADANWAYVKARKMERLKMWHTDPYRRSRQMHRIIWNYICDVCFGYGESILRTIITYWGIVLIFAILFTLNIPGNSFFDSCLFSLKNMMAQTPNDMKSVSTLVDMLNIIQTTSGILLTGILGFIIANRIRNQ